MKWLPNPYAIAQRLTNTLDIAPEIRRGGEAADAFLIRAFLSGRKQKTLTGAIAVLERIAGSFKEPVSLHAAIERSRRLWAEEGYTADEMARVLPELVPTLLLARETFADADKLVVQDVSYLDPVQGAIGDCYLISALSALAWADSNMLTVRFDAAGFAPPAQGSFQWHFHDHMGTAAGVRAVSGRIEMSGTQPRYARSSDPVEDWPSLVEKAYVAQVRNVGEPSETDYKSIDAKTGGSTPPRACQALVGGRVRGEILDSNRGRRIFLQGGRLESAAGVMAKPVMAWTKEELDLGSIHPRANDPNANIEDVWKETGLFPRHAYAVLGAVLSNDAVEHVVLRNPHGADINANRNGYLSGLWKPNGQTEVALNENGVFAISPELFYKHFEDIGWVDPL